MVKVAIVRRGMDHGWAAFFALSMSENLKAARISERFVRAYSGNPLYSVQ